MIVVDFLRLLWKIGYDHGAGASAGSGDDGDDSWWQIR